MDTKETQNIIEFYLDAKNTLYLSKILYGSWSNVRYDNSSYDELLMIYDCALQQLKQLNKQLK